MPAHFTRAPAAVLSEAESRSTRELNIKRDTAEEDVEQRKERQGEQVLTVHC